MISHAYVMRRLLRQFATEAKTAVKKKSRLDSISNPALPPFTLKQIDEPLPDLQAVKPKDVGLPWHKHWQSSWNSTLRAADVRLREQHDHDERSKLIDPSSNENLTVGSIVVVETVTSRTKPRPQMVAGVVVSVRRRGVSSNFTVRSYVLKTGVEMMFPVYSPMVTKIKVLRRAPERQDSRPYWDRTVLHFRGDPPGLVDSVEDTFKQVDDLAVRYREHKKRMAKSA